MRDADRKQPAAMADPGRIDTLLIIDSFKRRMI
jgi:hypothetical protein